MATEARKKGVKTKLFGVVLIALGALNSLLWWHGGLGDTNAPLILIACGVALFAIGAARGARHDRRKSGTLDGDRPVG